MDINKKDQTIIGGNFVHWYGGFDSYQVALETQFPISAPSMGRKQKNEESFPNLTHLSQLNWKEWMYTLASYKIGVHLMPTFAAGTFALNCGFLGIPCIGYHHLDTQRLIHPQLSVNYGDIKTAKQLAKTLTTDQNFWQTCSNDAKENYKTHFSELIFKSKAEAIFK